MFAHNQILHPYLAAEVQERFRAAQRRSVRQRPIVTRRRRGRLVLARLASWVGQVGFAPRPLPRWTSWREP